MPLIVTPGAVLHLPHSGAYLRVKRVVGGEASCVYLHDVSKPRGQETPTRGTVRFSVALLARIARPLRPDPGDLPV